MVYPKPRRRRGVILTPQGLEKLQIAKSKLEGQGNHSNHYTLEVLSEHTGLSVDTLVKALKCKTGVDKQTLKDCFKAFNLVLKPRDYCSPESQREEAELGALQLAPDLEPEFPEGQVKLGSRFYINRPPIEARCYQTVLQPGALLRIRAPRQMGKTSLLARILDYAQQQGAQTVALNLQLVDSKTFQDLDRFLQWFCARVTRELELPWRLADYWNEIFGSKTSCKDYFEAYLLPQLQQPLVVALDEVDEVFQYPEIADNFFALLRGWHEDAKNSELWQNLRLVLVHSTEGYSPLNINQSPFNIGLPIELPEFNAAQIGRLADCYELDWQSTQIEQLMSMVGGHPYLVQVALYHIAFEQIPLEEFLSLAPTEASLYSNHLRRHLLALQQQPQLASVLRRLVAAVEPELTSLEFFQLYRMGLIQLQDSQVMLRCELYRQYFGNCL